MAQLDVVIERTVVEYRGRCTRQVASRMDGWLGQRRIRLAERERSTLWSASVPVTIDLPPHSRRSSTGLCRNLVRLVRRDVRQLASAASASRPLAPKPRPTWHDDRIGAIPLKASSSVSLDG